MSEKNNILVIIQARMTSTRLPGKVLLPIIGGTVLERMIERVQNSKYKLRVVIATSTHYSDLPIVKEASRIGVHCFRGSMNNLLERHYQAALAYPAHLILKIPSDCPLIDSRIIDNVLDFFFENENKYDYVSNLHPATYPDGNDVEIMTWDCLERVFQQAQLPMEIEHTTPYIWENPDLFSIGNFSWNTKQDLSMTHRFTLDYEDDYKFIEAVYRRLYPRNPNFSCEDILDLLQQDTDLFQINTHYAGVNWYRHHLSDLKTITAQQTKISVNI